MVRIGLVLCSNWVGAEAIMGFVELGKEEFKSLRLKVRSSGLKYLEYEYDYG